MSDFTVTIVGTGAVGTSLGLALKQTDEAMRLLAHDKDLSIAKAAVKLGAFDKAEWNLINACEKASLIVLAIPLNGIRPTLEAIAPYLQEGTVITDVCRSKAPVLAAAREVLPDHVHFVGGDPIINPTGTGYENGRADLFRNRLYCLTPSSATHEEAVQLLVNFVKLVGGQPFFLDPEEHDGLVAATEYLPHLLSTALVKTLSEQTSWRETRKLAGRLFEQVSVGAEGDPDAIKDGVLENRQALLSWLDRYLVELAQLRNLIIDSDSGQENTGETLAQTIDQAVVARRNWSVDYLQGRFLDPELQTPEIENPSLLKRWTGIGR